MRDSNEKTIIKSTNKAGRKVAITLLSQGLNHFRDGNPDNFYNGHHAGNSFFIAEPALNLEVNVTHFFRFALGVGYRYTSGADYQSISDNTVSGFNGILTLKFGKF